MILHALIFYLFASVTIGAAAMVVLARNPVHSVLFLILAFFSSAGLFVLLGAEFIAMVLVVVYVGAVMVLFLFVVMMLDINYVALREGFLQYLPVGLLIGIVLLVELMLVMGGFDIPTDAAAVAGSPTPDIGEVSNIRAVGQLVYTKYMFLFQAAGMVLLVAMIGAIVLTLRVRPGVRKQKISEQVSRTPEDSVELIKVRPGQGL